MFHPRDRIRLQLILRGKRLGFSLPEIRTIVNMYDEQPGEAGQLQYLLDQIEVRRRELEQMRRDIDDTMAELDEVAAALPRGPGEAGRPMTARFEARPLTPDTWADLEELFAGPGGSIVRGCWCMYYRRTGKVSVGQAAGADNQQALCDLVAGGTVPGLVGYLDGAPVGGSASVRARTTSKLARSPS